MASKYTYLVEADGCYCGFTNRKDAIAEAEYRVRFHHDEKVKVIKYSHGDIVWKGSYKDDK